ncbi:MAG: hypothetical protein AMK72_05185 [Planctomycetes bacterium SM23_25]|nr:MAG: hypothetical protein AMK72_05185 [Planctomycetes bacterium SM23_25]
MAVTVILPGWLLLCITAQAAEFQAGIGRVIITPQTPMWMSGYAARTHPSDGLLQDLWAKALAIEDGQGGRVVIVTTDLIGLPREISQKVAARLATKHGIPRAQLVLNASHTHGGPAVWPGIRVLFDLKPDELRVVTEYAQKLTEDLVAVVSAALADLAPVRISFGHGSAGFAVNRREPVPGGMRIGVNPEGPVDHDVPVVRIAAPDGRPRAVLFGYACHNTTLGGDCTKINGDYAGFAQSELEKAYPGTTAMFLMLGGADLNPQPRGTVELAAQHGKVLADEVRRVLGGRLQPVRPPIRTAYEVVNLDLAPHDRAAFEAEAQGPDRFRQRRARLMLEAYDQGRPVRQVPCPVQVVRWNDDLALVALGGEVVVDYPLRLKREFGSNVIVAGYSNDVMCYIPSRRVLREGGYEAVESMIYYGQPGPFAENVEEAVISACRRLLKQTGAEPVGAFRPLPRPSQPAPTIPP